MERKVWKINNSDGVITCSCGNDEKFRAYKTYIVEDEYRPNSEGKFHMVDMEEIEIKCQSIRCMLCDANVDLGIDADIERLSCAKVAENVCSHDNYEMVDSDAFYICTKCGNVKYKNDWRAKVYKFVKQILYGGKKHGS